MKRIKLCDRRLPSYSKGEEIMNMVTHITGGAVGILVLLLCLLKAQRAQDLVGSGIYGGTMILLYGISSVYHGLHPCTGKKVMQIIDHCAIYFLIAGTYTPILLSGIIPQMPALGWTIMGIEWGLAALATALTAIDLKKYNVFSMICYIFMGWCIIFFYPMARDLLPSACFGLLLSGGIVYTLGAILYGVGVKVKWMHSVFHIFVVVGSFLQFLSIYLYIL